MKIIKTGMSGSLESSDVMITVDSNTGKGRSVTLESTVKRQYGKQILKVVENTADHLVFGQSKGELGVQDGGNGNNLVADRLEFKSVLFPGIILAVR